MTTALASAGLGPAAETAPPVPLPGGTEARGLCLIVADRNHVWVGRATIDPDWVTIENARIVRRWGTTRGLNQLAREGPQSRTVLDEPATVLVPRRALIALIPCEASRWTA